MTVVRVHASPDTAGIDRVRKALARFKVVSLAIVPGELVGDTVEITVAGDCSPMHEGEIRAAVLEAIETVPPPAGETVAQAIARLERELAALRAQVGGPVLQKLAMHEPAESRP